MKTAAFLWATVALLFAACASGPAPADIAADRSRWTGVRDATADGVIDPVEAPLVAELLVAWDEKLVADEKAAGRPQDPNQQVATLLRVYGAAVVQTILVPKLQAKAPHLFALLDVNQDQAISSEELGAVDIRDPVFALVVTETIIALIKKR
jgi:hypothetical protein